ncbi:hypothetical protein [Legionella bozemanae]|nr:hypothetical protein [Legionella bozemanae]
MDVVNEIISLIGIEYFIEEVSYSFDIENLNIKQYPHTNSIYTIESELLN